jgi:hypothetical protein
MAAGKSTPEICINGGVYEESKNGSIIDLALVCLASNSEHHASIGQLWSLWDMLRFYAKDFVEAISTYTNAKAVIYAVKADVALQEALTAVKIPTAVKDGLIHAVRQLYDITSRHGLTFVRAACGRLLNILAAGPPLADHSVSFLLDDIYVRLQDELKDRVFLAIDSDKVNYFEATEPLFGADVDAKFPSASFDITEAGKCYALERYTACVMHLMRALEKPLEAMAQDLKVSTARANWGVMIPAIETEISVLGKADADRRTLFSEVALQFRFVKDAWRDHVMHARGKYTGEEAKNAFDAAKAITQRLATRLAE